MSEIRIPFYERFATRLLDGTKTMTARTRPFGKPMDTFRAFGAEFVLVDVTRDELQFARLHWREEGCDSEDDFVVVWSQIHPRKGYVPTQRVWIHRFERKE